MNTKLIMTLSAAFLAAMGIAFIFLPQEIAAATNSGSGVTANLVFQALGALYFGFAMLNWMARGAIIGGIYNRPAAVANFTHFFIGALALIKAVPQSHNLPPLIWAVTFGYAVFATLFGFILFRHPGADA